MALQPCRECGAQVSTEAPTCPHCGVPDPAVLLKSEPPPPPQESQTRQSLPLRPTAPPESGRRVTAVAVGSLVLLVGAAMWGGVAKERERSAAAAAEAARQDSLAAVRTAEADSMIAAHPVETLASLADSTLQRIWGHVALFGSDQSEVALAWKAEARKLEGEARDRRQQEEAKRIAAERAAAERRSLAEKWTYRTEADAMTGRESRYATITSENTVNFDFPYSGPQHGRLSLRNHPSYGKDVILQIEQGQLLCRSYEDCQIRIRFDDGSPERWNARGPSDNSSTVLFIRNYDRFLQRLRNSDVVRIQPEVYQEGSPIFEFRVGGYDASKHSGG